MTEAEGCFLSSNLKPSLHTYVRFRKQSEDVFVAGDALKPVEYHRSLSSMLHRMHKQTHRLVVRNAAALRNYFKHVEINNKYI